MRLSEKKSLFSAGSEQSAGMGWRRGRGDRRWHISMEMKEEVRHWVWAEGGSGQGPHEKVPAFREQFALLRLQFQGRLGTTPLSDSSLAGDNFFTVTLLTEDRKWILGISFSFSKVPGWATKTLPCLCPRRLFLPGLGVRKTWDSHQQRWVWPLPAPTNSCYLWLHLVTYELRLGIG